MAARLAHPRRTAAVRFTATGWGGPCAAPGVNASGDVADSDDDCLQHSADPTYRLHDTSDDELGFLEHPAPNVEPADVVMLPGGREALVMARVEAKQGPLTALLEVAIGPSRLEADSVF
jgi:hypothetical protein